MAEFSVTKSAQELLADQMWGMLREIGVDPTFKDSEGFEMDADGVLLEVARIMIERIPVAEEPEWEYGVEMPLHTGTVVVASRDEATARAEAWLYPLHRRRKAGPWVPVNAGDGS